MDSQVIAVELAHTSQIQMRVLPHGSRFLSVRYQKGNILLHVQYDIMVTKKSDYNFLVLPNEWVEDLEGYKFLDTVDLDHGFLHVFYAEVPF